jgi:pimeloyl-ACP methyl ester carboxylesterase
MPVAHNGQTKLNYEVHGAGAETVVLVPGLGVAGAAWGPVTALLEGSHRVVVPDPRGSGASDTPDEPYTPDVVAADLRAVIDDAGADRIHLVGLSMGGMIAQDFALRHPDRVKSLVLLSTFAKGDAWFTRLFHFRRDLIRAVGLQEHFRLFVMMIFSPHAFRAVPETVARIDGLVRERPPDERAYLRQIDFCLEHDTSSELPGLRLPTLVISGAHDLLTPPELGRELAAAIPGARYEEFPLASHGLWLEHPQELAALLDEHVRANPSPYP